MNNKLSFLFIAALLTCNFSYAHIFRIGYSGPQVNGVDYAFGNADAAVTAASTGDTIQIYPGGTGASISSLNKQLVFIGVGYFLANNTGLQVVTTPSILGIDLTTGSAGASGSIFEGLQINTLEAYNLGGTILQNLLFTRCELGGTILFATEAAGDSIKNITFSQCYFTIQVDFENESANSTISGINFQNCIYGYVGYIATYNFATAGQGIITNITFENCSCADYPALVETGSVSSYYRNCIFGSEPTAANDDVYDYCTFSTNSATHYVTGTSDQFGIAFTSIFSGGTAINSQTEWDASWALATGSPCIGYGKDNSGNTIDAGAYGGVVPYRLSGIPPVPAFYILSAPSSSATANPYTITFSVRANN